MEQLILEELELFIGLIKKTQGESFDCINKFNLPILNALWRVTVGDRFDYEDETLISIIDRLSLTLRRNGEPKTILPLVFPWITKIYPQFMERDKTIETTQDMVKLMKRSVKEHEESLDENDPRDFIDKVLIEIKKTSDPGQTLQYYFLKFIDHRT